MSTAASLVAQQGWRTRAACLGEDTETFILPDGLRGDVAQAARDKARGICAGCPVRQDCLEYALDSANGFSSPEKYGIWGGLDEQERSHVIRTRRRHALAARQRAERTAVSA